MKNVLIGSIAALGIALASPAGAQVYFGAGPGGIGIGVGPGPGYYEGHRYRNYEGSYYSGRYDDGYRDCRTVRVQTAYGVRRERRCY